MCHFGGPIRCWPSDIHIQPTCYDLRKMLETLELIYIGLTFCGYAWQITMTCLSIMNTTFKPVKKQYKRNFLAGHHQEVIFLYLFLNERRMCRVLFDFHLISIKVLLLKKKKKKFSEKQNKVYTKKTLYLLPGTFSFLFFFYILVNYFAVENIKKIHDTTVKFSKNIIILIF